MKLTLLSIILIASSTLLAQIPNNGFENWTSMGTYNNPNDWGTLNNTTAIAGVYTATKGTPGSPGTAYLKLTSKTVSGLGVVNGIAVSGVLDSIAMLPKSGFAFNQRPASFTGKWQHMIYGSSQGSITVQLTYWDAVNNVRVPVATANQTLSGMAMSWANFTIPFTYANGNNPDTCIIIMKASGANPTNNDYLWVDNLAFAGSVVGLKDNSNTIQTLTVFPNPSSEQINLSFSSIKNQEVKIELLDLTGKIILSKIEKAQSGITHKTIDIKGIAKGIYFINLTNESGIETKKIIIE